MKVMLVPSSIATDGEEPSQYLISYQINESIAIDAGSLGIHGSPSSQAKIKHVLISHSHIDHTATLPIFVENAYEGKSDCVTIHGSQTVLESLRGDIFNDRTWPDFVALSEGNAPFLRLELLEPDRPVELEGVKITPISVNHVVPTLGFLIEDSRSAVLIASDTGPTDILWDYANRAPHLDAVFLEAAFPNAMTELANVSKHLTPAMFGLEVQKLKRKAAIVAVHIKARFRKEILRELSGLQLEDLQIGQFGMTYEW